MIRGFKKRFRNTTLKKKIVFLMATVAGLIPIILVSLLAVIYSYLGLNSLFNSKISKAVSETVQVAELYLQEHKKNIKADILSVVNDIDRNYLLLMENPEWFHTFLNKQAELRNLSELIIFTPERVIARSNFSIAWLFDKWPDSLIDKDSHEVIIDASSKEKVKAVIKLNNFIEDTYLMVGRYIDPTIVTHVDSTKGSAIRYHNLLADIDELHTKLKAIFLSVSFTLWCLAILIGIKLAQLIARPINTLVNAANSIEKGNLSVKVPIPEGKGKDETTKLAQAFNSMTTKISEQQNKLIEANQFIEERKEFIEAVLSDISAGLLVLSSESKILLYNNSATDILNIDSPINHDIRNILPEALPLLDSSAESEDYVVQKNIVTFKNGKKIHLFVRVGVIHHKSDDQSFIVTFDDISELVSAQRAAAWSEVARRLAHEIKNPLTPIQLASERLYKKYSAEVTEKELFQKYIDTIIRHVTDIEHMVDEFVKFAKIPPPKIEVHDLIPIIKEVLFSQQTAYAGISYQFNHTMEHCYIMCDRRQISQVFLNLLKNAAESVLHSPSQGQGKIDISVRKSIHNATIVIQDNGLGILKNFLDRLSDPYVTTKNKGTGLGLTIVRKILKDHNSDLRIKNNEASGASVSFRLKLV